MTCSSMFYTLRRANRAFACLPPHYLPRMGLLVCLLSLGLLCGSASAAQPAKGVFETCPACRLSAMPELKRFLVESIMKREYGDKLEVKYIYGKTPTLYLYDDAGKQISETEVDPALDFEALHKWVQGMSFVRQEPEPSGPVPSDLKVHTAAEAAPAGPPAPIPAELPQPGQGLPQQQQQRRRHRRRRMRQGGQQGAAAGAAAAAAAHRRPGPGGPANKYL